MKSQPLHSRVALTSEGRHLRYIPAAMASALLADGAAQPVATIGKISAVVLVRSAAAYARRIGDASEARLGVRFYRWLHLDTARVIEHHPRCLYQLPDE